MAWKGLIAGPAEKRAEVASMKIDGRQDVAKD